MITPVETVNNFLEKTNWSLVPHSEVSYEQYQVLNQHKNKIGLIRLHWGWFTVYEFNPKFKLILEEKLSKNSLQDKFKDETQKNDLLLKGLEALKSNIV